MPLICYCSQNLLADKYREYTHVFIHTHSYKYIYFYICLYKHIFGTKSSQLPVPIQHWGIHSSFFPFPYVQGSNSKKKTCCHYPQYIYLLDLSSLGNQLVTIANPFNTGTSYLHWALTPCTNQAIFPHSLADSCFLWPHLTGMRVNYSGRRSKNL